MSPRRMSRRQTVLLAAVSVALVHGAASQGHSETIASGHALIKGISYGPVPLLSQEGASKLPQDDWMADEAVEMWGRSGRGDLRVMKQLGANLVRLYGNNPENDHTNFLDEAHAEGLRVAPGMSDYPYFQQVPGRCLDTNFECFDQVKPMYAMNLERGFLTPEKRYHPALQVMNILNEPDLKMPPTTDIGGADGPIKMCRTIISAFDAMLDAEKEAGVRGPLINFTATFSYAICAPCEKFNTSPALGQMWQLSDAMNNPEKYGYTPKNDISKAYRERWTHSFNTQNPATDLQHQFLDDYEVSFPTTPVYIGEYHRVNADQTEDLNMILGLAENSPLFQGISFFEFQVAYWKTGSEMDFGMFGLGEHIIAEMPYFGETYNIHCLTPQDSQLTPVNIPAALAQVYGGAGIDDANLCIPSPWQVALDATGYGEIVAQQSAKQMSGFVQRLVQHLGATVTDQAGLESYAEATSAGEKTFATLVSELAYGPDWVLVDPKAKCVANRNVAPSVIGQAIGWVCSHAQSFSCADIPPKCNETYRTGDWVFSRYYKELGKDADPMSSCNFDGAGLYAAEQLYDTWTGAWQCIQGGQHSDIQITTTSQAPGTGTTSEPSTTGSASTSTPAPETSLASSGRPASIWLVLGLLAGRGLLWK